jgi:valyl-tRNA synthetase
MAEYNAQETEKKILDFWEKEKIFKFDSKRKGTIYSIDTPPPTVSGKMHIGHAFSYSQQDFIVRFNRMLGNVYYPFGTDDNGLPTERLIEKLKNVRSKEMSREEFIKLCLKTLKEITPQFIQDWKNLGVSCDYGIYYSTIDDNSRKISQRSFIELYKKGLIYKKEFPSLWCPECQTSVAQAELEDKELKSLFSTIKFSCDGKDLLIATTRPELTPACVAVFVNPKDLRYKKLIGKKAKVPLFNHEVPIIGDASAQVDKGTGVLMVCSYGDKYDADAIKRHKLNPKIVLNLNGTLNTKPYEGMKIKDARKKILQDLNEKGLITEQKEINHIVNTHDKCGTEIEFLSTEQWFIKVLENKKEFIKQGNKIKWHPKFMHKRYNNWVNGLEWDWNISRDRHFGVSIPVWECENCKEIIIADEKELPLDPTEKKKVCPKCKKEAKAEKKVFDTWMTSSLSPQIISSLIENKVVIPYSLRPQAHDIIRTWLFYTAVKSYYHENKIPWKNVMISGFVTLGGEKMSKSKGNGIEPQIVIDTFGADALRFWAASSKLGEDLDYQEKDLVAGKKFLTKLFNASQFVSMNLADFDYKKPKKLEAIDLWMLAKTKEMVDSSIKSYKNYNISEARKIVENFFWHTLCDNYLEIVKKRIYEGKGNKKSAQYVLYNSLLAVLKMIAPITPFITEELYQKYFKEQEKELSIHLTRFPKVKVNEKLDSGELFIEILSKIRQEKTKFQKSMKAEIILTLEKKEFDKLKNLLEDLKDVTTAKEIRQGSFKIEFV